jgi:hypothetical protein
MRLLTALSLALFLFAQAGAAPPQTTGAAPPAAEQLAETNRKIRSLADEKKHAEAAKLAEASIEEAARLFGPDSTQVSAQLGVLADVLVARGDKGKAKKAFARLLELREKRRGPSEKFEQEALEQYACLVANDFNSTPERDFTKRMTTVFVEDSVLAQGIKLSPDRGELRIGGAMKKPAPFYPPDAKRAHLSGGAVLALVIDEGGLVKYASPLGCTTRAFRMAAQEAALRVLFEPTLVNGKPVEVRSIIFYRWVIQ